MTRTVLLIAALLASTVALADASHHAKPAQQETATAPSALAEGEIRKVDKSAGKITIKHGPLASVDMPAMTMVFRVKDESMLDKVKAGDNIRFKAEKIDGAYTVTEYQAAK